MTKNPTLRASALAAAFVEDDELLNKARVFCHLECYGSFYL